MNGFSLPQILAWSGGRLLAGVVSLQSDQPEPVQPVHFNQLSTDTRAVGQDDLFLALRGARFDGHEFLCQAIATGATGLVIDEASLADPGEISLALQHQVPPGNEHQVPPGNERAAAHPPAVIVVKDTLAALQAIAAGYRTTLHAPVIGITGSVGKTSTRGMVAACLNPVLKICQTAANNNNEIGLPKTILSAVADDQAVILEMGMRGRGEIELLSTIAQPDIALITNVGLAHIERLGSQDEILKAKAEIISGLKPGGLLILNADDLKLRQLGHELQSRFRIAFISTVPLADNERHGLAEYLATDIITTGESSQFTLHVFPQRPDRHPLKVCLPVTGRHMVSNSLFGLAVADALGIDLRVAAAGAAGFANTGNRQRLLAAGPVIIMDDSYNASPESMLAAIETLKSTAGSRRLVAALGGMLELGSFAPDAHRRVGEAAALAGYDLILAIGPHAADLAAGFSALAPDRKIETFMEQQQLISRLLENLQPGDALLVKGSRGFAMELVTRAVIEHYSAPEAAGTASRT